MMWGKWQHTPAILTPIKTKQNENFINNLDLRPIFNELHPLCANGAKWLLCTKGKVSIPAAKVCSEDKVM